MEREKRPGTLLKMIFSIRKKSGAERVELLDFLRGFAMILVLLHHSGSKCGDYILAFHMPFFFVLSGYIEYQKKNLVEKPFGPYVKTRFFRLIYPYLFFEIVNLFLYVVQEVLMDRTAGISIPEAVFSIVTVINRPLYKGFSGRLWFLPCMFISSLFFWIVFRVLNKTEKRNLKNTILFLFAILFLAVSWCTNKLNMGRLPLTIDTAFMATFYLLLGYLAGVGIDFLLYQKSILLDFLFTAVGCAVVYLVVKSEKAQLYMYINSYGNYIYSILGAVCGSAAFLIIGKWVYRLSSICGVLRDFGLWYGANSLASFPVHLEIKWAGKIILGKIGLNYSMVLFALMLLLTVPIVNLLTAVFPLGVGKVSKRTQRKQT